MAASMVLQVAVSPLLGVLFDNLTSPILKQVGLLWGVEKELKKLTSTVSAIQVVLDDAENKQLTSKPISDWLLKLKDAAYDADDILDEWATVANQASGSLSSRFSFKQIKFRHKIRERMSEINQRFDDITSQRSMFGLNEGAVERRAELYPSRITSSIPTDSEIYGREDDIKFIVEWLLNNTGCPEVLSICSILGIGGLGKTTLAQSVFNDEKVTKHFDIKIWVCVLTNFDISKLTRAVLDSFPGAPCNSEQLDPLQRCLQERLAGKRFLLVLDDVWNENQEEWDRFKISLKCGSKGSSAIVTTRLETVATITGTCPHYSLKYLSEEDCCVLFERRAFGVGNEERPALVNMGKEIVKKCGGVPLAAKVLGGLLRFKTEESEWLYLKDSRIWDLPQSSENSILPALRLSYTHLSPHLRECFAYCSLFQQDFRMEKEEVIQLWMANGLLQPRGRIQLEDIGNEIFNSWVWRSLFQVVEKDISGDPKSFVMHDLVHDLSCFCFVAKNECYNMDWSCEIENVPNGTRHLSIKFNVAPSSSMFQHIHQSAPKLRTLILYGQGKQSFPTHIIFSIFKCLRALSKAKSGIEQIVIPESIGKLKHLRYLDLSYSIIEYLPKSICGLINLQTLNLNGCDLLKVLPKRLSNLSNLRHLHIKKCRMLSKMPRNIGRMTCLQTLSIFIVGSNKGEGIKELETMDNLSGELIIKCLENVRSRGDAECANLMKKKRLKKLHLRYYCFGHTKEENEKDVIEGLRPCSDIRMLNIEDYQGICFPSWLEYSSLPNLVEISLQRCTRCEILPSLDRLPFLKVLGLWGMPFVRFLFHNDGDDVVDRFTSLERLHLNGMPELEDWCSFTGNSGVGEQMFLPQRLKELRISGCPKLKRALWPPAIGSLHVSACNEVVLGSLKNLPNLSSMSIGSFDEGTCFPEGSLQGLTALTNLRIYGFKQLEILPRELGDLSKLTSLHVSYCNELVSLTDEIRNLCSLESLRIEKCRKLKSPPRGILNGFGTCLTSLSISDCPNLEWTSLEFEHLPALQSLDISSFSEMTSLPDGIQNLFSTLEGLYLQWLESLTSLPEWIGSMKKLQRLSVTGCQKLRMLPEGLPQLTNLQSLTIKYCHPDLQRRCQNRKGEDWHKISHIPNLSIQMT